MRLTPARMAFPVFALFFVGVVAALNSSLLTAGAAYDKLSSIVEAQDSSLMAYNDTTVFGTTVAKCASDPTSIASIPIQVQVITSAGGDAVYSGEKDEQYSSKDPSSEDFINRYAKFSAVLTYEEETEIVTIVFTQES